MPEAPTKRKPGRPSARHEVEVQEKPEMVPAVEPGVRQSHREPWTVIADPQSGPLCPRCNTPTERNSQMFKALDLVANRCLKCKHCAIEGDTQFFDLKTAAGGLLLRRAMVVYEAKHPTQPTPNVKVSNLSEIIESEAGDPRWNQ